MGLSRRDRAFSRSYSGGYPYYYSRGSTSLWGGTSSYVQSLLPMRADPFVVLSLMYFSFPASRFDMFSQHLIAPQDYRYGLPYASSGYSYPGYGASGAYGAGGRYGAYGSNSYGSYGSHANQVRIYVLSFFPSPPFWVATASLRRVH
jgi:hypothetical protein